MFNMRLLTTLASVYLGSSTSVVLESSGNVVRRSKLNAHEGDFSSDDEMVRVDIDSHGKIDRSTKTHDEEVEHDKTWSINANNNSGACKNEKEKMCSRHINCNKRAYQRLCKKACGLCTETASDSTPATQPDEASAVTGESTTPTPINADNKGSCYPNETSVPDNVKWYTWKVGDEQRCTSVYIPPESEASRPMPVMLQMNCYGLDQTASEQFGRFPVANFLLSTQFVDQGGKGGWRTGNDGIVTDANPQPCSDEDTPEIAYIKAIFQIIEDDPATFDASKIYTYGFSQNSMFSAYVGFCFSHKVAGIVQTGSGLVVNSEGVRSPPNKGGYCTYSDYNEYGNTCSKTNPCEECEYWPIYPCYEKRPVIHCGLIYQDDFLQSSMQPMYDKAVAEGFDARLIEVPGGSHKELQNSEEWYAGCLGITDACSATCATDVAACIESSSNDSDEAYADCTSNALPASCSSGCAPTLDMLILSQKPSSILLSRDVFGATQSDEKSKPSTSKCEHTY